MDYRPHFIKMLDVAVDLHISKHHGTSPSLDYVKCSDMQKQYIFIGRECWFHLKCTKNHMNLIKSEFG